MKMHTVDKNHTGCL